MTLGYQTDFDDFREADRAINAARSHRRLWVILAAASGLLAVALVQAVVRPPGAAWDPVRALVRMLLLIAAFPLYYLTILRLPMSRTTEPFVDVSRRIGWPERLVAVNTVLLSAVTLICVLPLLPSDPTASAGVRAATWSVSILPVGIAVVIGRVYARMYRRRTFNAQPGIPQPRTADLTAAGAAIDTGLILTTYRPAAFVRVIETPGLFLLCPSFVTFEAVPKRAFASADQMAEFRRLAAAWATARQTVGFPVLSPVQPDPFPMDLEV